MISRAEKRSSLERFYCSAASDPSLTLKFNAFVCIMTAGRVHFVIFTRFKIDVDDKFHLWNENLLSIINSTDTVKLFEK